MRGAARSRENPLRSITRLCLATFTLAGAFLGIGLSLGVQRAGADTYGDDNTASSSTYIFSGAKTTNFGDVDPAASASAYRGLIQFDTSSIPTGAVIDTATLYLTPDVTESAGSFMIHNEGPYFYNTVTWANQPRWNSTVIGTTGATTVDVMTPATLVGADIATGTGAVTAFGVSYSTPGVVPHFAGIGGEWAPPALVVTYHFHLHQYSDTVGYVYSGAPTTNFRGFGTLDASSSSYRAFVSFDTSSIPAGATVTSVDLLVTPGSTKPRGGFTVFAVADTNSSPTWSPSTLDWDNRPPSGGTVLGTSSTPRSGTPLAISLPTSSVNIGNLSDFELGYSVAGIVGGVTSGVCGLEVSYTTGP